MDIKSARAIGLDASHLVTINDSRLLADRESLEAFFKLQDSCLKENGFSLDIASAYRSFMRQCEIIEAKFLGKRPILDINEKVVSIENLTPFEIIKAITLYSALPGFSAHHYGTDFDVYSKTLLKNNKLELTAYEWDEKHYFYNLHTWFLDNLEHYGFYRPFLKHQKIGFEPWHISYKKRQDEMKKYFNITSVYEAYETVYDKYAFVKPCLDFIKSGYYRY